MTSELKPNYVKFSREICQFAFEGCDADGFTIQEIGVKCGVLKVEGFDEEKHPNIVNAEDFEAGDDVYLFVEPIAAPDVPELVTVAHMREAEITDIDGETYKAFIHASIDKSGAFPVVRRSQAAEIIAAERAEKEKLILASNDMFKTAVVWQERAKAAEAKLAQMEKQS